MKFYRFFFGAGNQIRTDDLFITSELLYRLSHTSVRIYIVTNDIKNVQ